MPSPYVLTVPHSVSHRSQSSVEITTPSLTNEEAVPTREKMDMGMAATGTEAAQAGIHTPLATYTGQSPIFLSFDVHLLMSSANGRMAMARHTSASPDYNQHCLQTLIPAFELPQPLRGNTLHSAIEPAANRANRSIHRVCRAHVEDHNGVTQRYLGRFAVHLPPEDAQRYLRRFG